MALHIPKAPGVPQMLKEGARVSLINITKISQVSACVKTDVFLLLYFFILVNPWLWILTILIITLDKCNLQIIKKILINVWTFHDVNIIFFIVAIKK